MDSKRFDNWTRNRAVRLSRRDALRMMAFTGAAAALPSFVSDAMAQSSCSLTIHAETTGGPSAPTSYDGELTFSLESEGGFSQASFTPSNAATQPVSGQVTGRSIDFQVTLAGGQMIAFTGAGDQTIASCQGATGGLFSGPQPGDLGAWTATSGATSSAFAAAAAPVPAAGASTSTTTANAGGSCVPPLTPCGSNCCPGGATCTDSTQGLCACPNGTEQCGNSCVASCSDGQQLDLDSCTCPPAEAACIQNTQTCANHGQCCSGYCAGGTCFDCAGKVCGIYGCIDPTRDPQNCGNCGNVCISPQVCANSTCGCGPVGAFCASDDECCTQFCHQGTCLECYDTNCGSGVCVNLDRDKLNCGACFYVCPVTSSDVECVAGVCHDLNNDNDYCGRSGESCPPGHQCHAGACSV